MIFLGTTISWILTVIGLISTVRGVYLVATYIGAQNAEAAMQALPSATNLNAIDQGMLMLFFGVALGLLTIIAKNTVR